MHRGSVVSGEPSREFWSDKSINSANFKNATGHQNPDSFPYESTQQIADKVTVDRYFSADSMIQRAQEDNKILTWILRFVGFILLLVGMNLIFRPLSVLADVLPIDGI